MWIQQWDIIKRAGLFGWGMIIIRLPWPWNTYSPLKPGRFCSFEVPAGREAEWHLRLGDRFNISSSTRDDWLNHNEEKYFENTTSTSRYSCYSGEKYPHHVYWVCFHFPWGGIYCNEKRNEGRLFLTECSVNTVDFTGRADRRGSCRGRTAKWVWSIWKQMISDPRPPPRGAVVVNNTPRAYQSSWNEGKKKKKKKGNQWVISWQTNVLPGMLMTGIH